MSPFLVWIHSRNMRLTGAVVAMLVSVGGCGHSGPAATPADPAVVRAEREVCAELKRMLFQDPIVRSYAVYARCDSNRVTLNGTVPDYQARQQAERIARSMPGIQFVQNNLRITDPDELIRY